MLHFIEKNMRLGIPRKFLALQDCFAQRVRRLWDEAKAHSYEKTLDSETVGQQLTFQPIFISSSTADHKHLRIGVLVYGDSDLTSL